MVSYRVMLDVPRDLIWFVSGLLAVRRRQIGTRRGTRRLGCYRQALFALAWFRDKGDIPRLGRGFGLPQSTAYRYLDEVIEVLAARAPGLREQLERALADGVPYLILDGKVVDADRCREKTVSRKGKVIDLRYAGKTHDFGGNIQALFYPCGIPRDAISFLAAMEFSQADLLGFSIGSFVAQQIALVRPGIVRRLVLASSAPKGAAGMWSWMSRVRIPSLTPCDVPRHRGHGVWSRACLRQPPDD